MARTTISVVKIGGSLLKSAELPRRLRAWFANQRAARPDAHLVALVGGGRLVDALREINSQTPLCDDAAHKIAIELMDVTAGIVAAMLPELFLTSDFEELVRRTAQPGITLFRPADFMARVEPRQPGQRLPASWEVTSDSIAARLAIVLGAAELVLLKAAAPPDDAVPTTITAWSEMGYVDSFLPSLASEMPLIRAVVPD